MSTLSISIITPDQTVFEGTAASITLPTAEGEITVLPHHIPLIGMVVPGSIIIRQGREERLFAVSRGTIEVDGTSVRILADTADRAEELEEAAIEEARKKAEALVTEKRSDAEAFADATAILERELARLKVVRRHRSRRLGVPSSNQ